MGADADRAYQIYCRYWQSIDMSRIPELDKVIYSARGHMDGYLSRSGVTSTNKFRKITRTPRPKHQEEAVSQTHTTSPRDIVPLCPVPLSTSTLADEHTFVREHYGDNFSCVGDIWNERTAMRLCTGHWYSTHNIAAVIETLETNNHRSNYTVLQDGSLRNRMKDDDLAAEL
jgi:hypothetical protein